jgi:hypothetical protein
MVKEYIKIKTVISFIQKEDQTNNLKKVNGILLIMMEINLNIYGLQKPMPARQINMQFPNTHRN